MADTDPQLPKAEPPKKQGKLKKWLKEQLSDLSNAIGEAFAGR